MSLWVEIDKCLYLIDFNQGRHDVQKPPSGGFLFGRFMILFKPTPYVIALKQIFPYNWKYEKF